MFYFLKVVIILPQCYLDLDSMIRSEFFGRVRLLFLFLLVLGVGSHFLVELFHHHSNVHLLLFQDLLFSFQCWLPIFLHLSLLRKQGLFYFLRFLR
jgi:hypothetical protein